MQDLNQRKYRRRPAITSLPPELVSMVCKYLTIQSIIRLRKSCRRLSRVIEKRPLLYLDAYRTSILVLYLNPFRPRLVLELFQQKAGLDRTFFNQDALFLLCNYGLDSEINSILGQNSTSIPQSVKPDTNNHYILKMACQKGHTQLVANLLQDPRTTATAQNNTPLILACTNGHQEIVAMLLPRSNIASQNQYCIRHASKNGHLQVVRMLLGDERVDPASDRNFAVRKAAANGFLEIVEVLLGDSRTDPSDLGDYAIIQASENGKLRVVEFLLRDGRVDPAALDNEAMRRAAEYGQVHVVERLLVEGRVDPSDCENMAVVAAASRGHFRIVQRLVCDCRVRRKLGVVGLCLFKGIGWMVDIRDAIFSKLKC